jgi:hypothetical protein
MGPLPAASARPSAALRAPTPQGLAYPVTAAIVNAAWVVGRVMYTLGYSTGDPKKRIPGGQSTRPAPAARASSCLC